MSGGFLETVVDEVRRDVALGTYDLPARGTDRPPPASLRGAVVRRRPGLGVVVEYKRRSPGRETPVLPRRAVGEFVGTTAVASVVGYSCLATRPRFDGAPSLVAELARSTDRPVLFKDFVVESRQLDAAQRAGASAVLLIARLATDVHPAVPLADLAEAARRRGLEVLLELHAPEEVRFVDELRPDLVGVNVRDLDTLRLERDRAFRTIAQLRELAARPILGLSGVESRAEAREFEAAGCDAIVVGSAVALARDPAAFLRALVGAEGLP